MKKCKQFHTYTLNDHFEMFALFVKNASFYIFSTKINIIFSFFVFFLTFAVNSAFYKVKSMSVKISFWQNIIHRVINHPINGSCIVFDNKYGKAWKEKSPNKVMVWVAISNRGISKPLFRPSKPETTHVFFYLWASPSLKLYFLVWFRWLSFF